MKDKDTALKVAGVVFLLVAIMHFVRLLWKIQVTLSGIQVGLYLSLIAFIVALSLAIWMFAATKKEK